MSLTYRGGSEVVLKARVDTRVLPQAWLRPRLTRQPKRSRVQIDFDHLLDRLGQRWYPETLNVLAFYWLKTIYTKSYSRDEWVALDSLLNHSLGSPHTAEKNACLIKLQGWIRESGLLNGKALEPEHLVLEKGKRPLDTAISAYLVRLLNTWLPVEVSRLLIEEIDVDGETESGIPGIAMARALERILVRERLPLSTLQALLRPELVSPRLVYPAEYEILRDVVLYLLGCVEAPSAPVLPPTLLTAAPDARFSSDYDKEVRRGTLQRSSTDEDEELHVPIKVDEAERFLEGGNLHIASVVVTMDGRWWRTRQLKAGEQNALIYRPMGRLRIDFSTDHARLRVPWPEMRLEWSGSVRFPDRVHIFGREWSIERWEQAAEETWVDLVFAGTLAAPTVQAGDAVRRCRPASVDIAWAALEAALARSIAQKDDQFIQELRREELVPLGRALYSLVETTTGHILGKREELCARLNSVRFFAESLRPNYGPVPFRVLPESARKALLRRRAYHDVSEALQNIFEGLSA